MINSNECEPSDYSSPNQPPDSCILPEYESPAKPPDNCGVESEEAFYCPLPATGPIAPPEIPTPSPAPLPTPSPTPAPNPNPTPQVQQLEEIGQLFSVDYACVITSAKLKFRTAPRTTGEVGIIKISRTERGLPTAQILGIAILDAASIKPSDSASLWSEAKFERPAILPYVGEYAITYTPLVAGGEVYIARTGDVDVNTGLTSGQYRNIVRGHLLTKAGGSWQINYSGDLSFELIKAVPTTFSGEAVFNIDSKEAFDFVELYHKLVVPPGTAVQTSYRQTVNQPWKLIESHTFYLQTPSNNTQVKFTFNGTQNLFPFLETDILNVITNKNSLSSTWVSTTVNQDNYNNINISFEAYEPEGTKIIPSFSSNAGFSWEPLELENKAQIINGDIPLYKHVYRKEALSDSILYNDKLCTLRTKLTLRLDFSTTTSSLVPFARKIASLTY